MKGWFNDPYRHSLAARGIPTYLYHGTASESLKGIMKDRGIVPWKDKIYSISDDYVYLTIDEYSGDFWARKARKIVEDETGIEMTGVLLRVKKDELLKIGDILPDDEVSGESYMFTGNIPLDLIEMKTSVGWMGLEEYENLTSKGVPIYLYHGTTTGRFRDIKRGGLSMDPGFRNWADSEFIYFTMDEENVETWAEHSTRMFKEESWEGPGKPPGKITKTKPLILRVSKEDLEEEDLIENPILEELGSDPDMPWVAYLNNIPPELIEVKTPTGWKKLKSKNFTPKFITGGDGVGREYHGYISAVNPETGKIVGRVTYVYYNDKTYIKHIEVLPDYRRRGIGTALVKELKKESSDLGMMGTYATEEGQIFFGQVYPEILKPDLAELDRGKVRK